MLFCLPDQQGPHEISSPAVFAVGNGCRRVADRIADHKGANLSLASGARDGRFCRRSSDRYRHAHCGSIVAGAARSAVHHLEPPRRRRPYPPPSPPSPPPPSPPPPPPPP